MSKNPFLVFEDFISPLQCEELIINNGIFFPNVDREGKIIPYFFGNKFAEVRLMPRVIDLVLPKIETHYDVKIKGVLPFQMEWYPEGYNGHLPAKCENSVFYKDKWKRVNDHDFTGVLFLNNFRETMPFDPDFEVLGGKLEFPNHGFSFNPERGRLIVFPGSPNFVNHTAAIEAGNLTQIRFHIASEQLYVYNMSNFPGDYTTWF